MARAATTSDAFNAVAEPRRRDILSYLVPGERPVGDIAAALGLEQPAASKHLRVLRDVGLVRMRADGRQKLYRANAEAIKPVHAWTSRFERLWQHQLNRIKERAEADARKGGFMPSPNSTIDPRLTLNITQEIRVDAPLDATFTALLEQIGPANVTPDGKPMPMKLEPWPGGRWYRDLGGDNGHFWGHVQAIKRPALLEITGPLFASYPFLSNLQYRLAEVDGGTSIIMRHTAFGFIAGDHREGIGKGWAALLERVRKYAEAASSPTMAGRRSR